MKRTIFFDVDNTLVCREKNVMCDYTIKAIKMCKNNGINVAIATGSIPCYGKAGKFL